MRSTGAKGNATNGIDGLVENGISLKDEDTCEAHRIAEKVVQNVVQRASKEAEQRSSPRRGCDLPRLPTIQIDTVPSPPWSPAELSPVEDEQEEPIDEEQIDLNLEEQQPSEELRESLRSYVEDILSQAMGVAEKKLKFVGLDDDEEEEEEEAAPPPPEEEEAPPQQDDDEEEDEEEAARKEQEIRSAAQRVVEEVISQATETVAARLEEEHNHPQDLPSFQIDTVVSAPPSPDEAEVRSPADDPKKKKWTFRMKEEDKEEVNLMTFDESPDDVKEVASTFVKDIVGRAITIAEEKSAPTTVPFNFEDVDLMKTSGPWYVRVREALLRVLRSACFCTPRRNDS